jgi:hypothetical protein
MDIDAPIESRYARMQARARDGEARIALEAFQEREKKEMMGTQSETDAHIMNVKALADITLNNTGTLEEFFDIAEKALSLK